MPLRAHLGMSPNDTTRRDALKLLGAGAAITTIGTGTVAAQQNGGPVLEFKRMVGNDLTGSDGAIRGVDAGGAPWVLDEAEVKLDADGHLKVEVEGLVLDPDTVPTPPDGPGGTNPIPEFRAILSCLAPDSNDQVVESIRTSTFEANEDGDSEIEEEVDIPNPCLAPIVFVAGPEEILGSDLWFAVTGF